MVILRAIKGYRIIFNELPEQFVQPTVYPMSNLEKQKINLEINKMLAMGVVEFTQHQKDEFVSNIFARPKKDGSVRVILNLTKLNDYVEYQKFKMDTFMTVVKMVTPYCYMATIDLKLAYYLIPVHVLDRKYLKFMWNDKLMQYTVLPNGLSSAPRLFTKIMKPVLATLREQGHLVSCYIDDVYIQGDTFEDCSYSLRATSKLLEKLGFVINKEKSMVLPRTLVTVLGFKIDSINMLITLPKDKVTAITALCKRIQCSDTISIRFLAKIIGNLVACFPAVTYGQMNYRQLDYIKIKELASNKGNYDAKMRVPSSMVETMRWWIKNLPIASAHIDKGKPQLTIETDASLTGWGAVCQGEHTGGAFTDNDMGDYVSINLLELKAIQFGILAFQEKILKVNHILIKTDNTTAIAYIKNMGGKKGGCNQVARELWQWCMDNNVWLSVTHIPGVENIMADYESRKVNDRTEWRLDPVIFNKINNMFGPLTIDLFASRTNSQLDRYAAWKPDPYAICIDAFTFDWNSEYFYAFPPFSVIGSVLQKIEQDAATGVIICPLWTTQSWFPVLMRMLIDDPYVLPNTETLLQLTHKQQLIHPLYPQMKLLVCRLSGARTRVNTYQETLSTYSCPHGGQARGNNMLRQLKNGLHFAIKNKSIYINQL